jgi:hypothetical protein
MKKGLLLAVVIAAITLSANAQEHKKDRLADLQLTIQQKASVDSVRKIYDGKRASLKSDATTEAEAKKEKMKQIRKEQNEAINSILTKEQRQQLKKETKEKGKKED